MTAENSGIVRSVKICNKRGLHARASAKFVTLVGAFDADVSVSKDGSSVCGTSIMGLMMLGAAIGDEITIKSIGKDQVEAMEEIVELVENKFYEAS